MRKKTLTVSIPETWHDELHRIAEKEFISASDLVRGQLKKFLSENCTNVLQEENNQPEK